MPIKANLLIIDDDANTLASLARAFRLAGHEATVCDSADRALELARSQSFDLIFSDVVMPGKDGLRFLEEFKALGISTPVVMMSGQGHISMAVRATKLGALDFLEKPISTEKLLLTVENAVRLHRLEQENKSLRQKLGAQEILWRSQPMRKLMAQVERVAPTETRVCILGETGVGKELVARALHQRSRRAGGEFVAINCAAVPPELVESELFGHEKGAFTGAGARHIGKFEQADGGTLFLDEIGEMPPAMQAKLLRVLEGGEIERVGGNKPTQVDVRVLVATHRNLEELVRAGKFRQDLFHRIMIFPLRIPALRERREDIPLLAEQFAAQLTSANGWPAARFNSEALALLENYSWPGNVRELRNAVERILLFAQGNEVDAAMVRDALPQVQPSLAGAPESGGLAGRVSHFEREAVLAELKRQRNHITRTAQALHLERSHLYKKCQQLGIDLRALRREEDAN
jgi:two-component system, NtrC family, nitrogen regulation response regulator NtrX